MKTRIVPMTRYVSRLYGRMNAVGRPGDDTFRIAVERAYHAMRDPSTELYYIGNRSRVGRSPKAE